MRDLSKFAKRDISMRYWLLGSKYHLALAAMEYGKRYHTGVRKDGVTPEYDHQISIAHYIRTLSTSLINPEETIAVAFLHDVREDYHVGDSEIRQLFGDMVADAVEVMTKEFRGVRKDDTLVFEQIAANHIASIAKGADRIHNFSSMVGVFSAAKQMEYIAEGERYFLPMLKTARHLHHRQEPAYENIKQLLTTQIALIKEIHSAKS